MLSIFNCIILSPTSSQPLILILLHHAPRLLSPSFIPYYNLYTHPKCLTPNFACFVNTHPHSHMYSRPRFSPPSTLPYLSPRHVPLVMSTPSHTGDFHIIYITCRTAGRSCFIVYYSIHSTDGNSLPILVDFPCPKPRSYQFW